MTIYRFPFLQATGKPSNINLTASIRREVFIDVPTTQKRFKQLETRIEKLSTTVKLNEQQQSRAQHALAYRSHLLKQSQLTAKRVHTELLKAAYALARASRGATVTLLDGREFDVQIEGHVLVFQQRSLKRKRKK